MKVEDLRQKYNLSLIEAEKAELLCLWFRIQNCRYVSTEEFDKRYQYLFGERPLWYTWGPFYRDHGCVGLRTVG